MGFPGTISVKFVVDVTGWPTYNTPYAENVNRLSRVHERYTQTDDRRTGDSIVHVRKKTM